MKTKLFLFIAAILIAFSSCSSSSESKMFDTKHHTMYFCGTSIADGKDAIKETIMKYGFNPEKEEDVDLSFVGGKHYKYQKFTAFGMSNKVLNEMTYNLFNLDETQINEDLVLVVLHWLPSGIVDEIFINIGSYEIPEVSTAVNKKLSELFPHSKISNKSNGYMTYYDDYGNGIYYSNDFCLQISFDNK